MPFGNNVASQVFQLRNQCGLAWFVLLSTTIRVIVVVKICFGLTPLHLHDILTTVMARIVVDKSSDHEYAKPNSKCFLPQYQRQRKFFFRARAEKDIARHIDSSSVVWTLINNGKLANQIARSAASVVK